MKLEYNNKSTYTKLDTRFLGIIMIVCVSYNGKLS